MLRSLALSTLALLALDGLSTAVAPVTGRSLTQAAAAADDDGAPASQAQIKSATVKTRAKASGGYTFSFWVRPEGRLHGSVASVTGTITDPVTGAVLQEVELTEGIRTRLVFSGSVGAASSLDSVRVYPQVAADHAASLGLSDDELEVLASGLALDESGEAIVGPLKLRGGISASGELRLKVQHEDKNWDAEGVTGVAVADAEGSRWALGLEGVRQVFQQGLDSDFIVIEDDIMIRASARAADGTVLDSVQERITVGPEAGAAPGLDTVRLKETKGGDTKLVTWTDSSESGSALEVELVDADTGASALLTVDDAPIQVVRSFQVDAVQFDPGESPSGYGYLCLIDLLDGAGDPVGEQVEVELTVPQYDAETGTEGTAWQTVTDSTGAVVGSVGFYATAEGVQLAAAWSGGDPRDVASMNLIFEEPFEGPAPLETEVKLAFAGERSKWVQKAEGAVPARFSLTTTLVTPEGEELDSVVATGGGTGVVYKAAGNGKGTKKASVQASQQHFELL